MNYFKNLETIARGKGSPQARDHDEECEMCNEDLDEEKRDCGTSKWVLEGEGIK